MKTHKTFANLIGRTGLTLVMALLACWPATAQTPLPQSGSGQQIQKPAYLDPNVPIPQRVNDLVSRMTLEEKVSQMQDVAPAIPRLGIPVYNWWNEALHGVARAGTATVFPQAIGLAATWDADLLHRVADVVSTEARAKYNDAQMHGSTARYSGLTFWSPNINIFRDPRWGRGQETYGEDPYLTSRMGVAFVTGLQGDDANYLKTISTPKHFAVHSGPEQTRHRFDVPVSLHDLVDTYLPAFRATIIEGKADSVMCAYNSVLGAPACASTMLLGTLRNLWGFQGYVVSDCGAVSDIFEGHRYAPSREKSAAVALTSGTDLTCGNEFHVLASAVRDEMVTSDDVDNAVKRLFEARFRLGMFDPPAMVPWSKLTLADNDTPEHRALALQAARESIVLLKNERNALPLSRNTKTIAVIGPVADSVSVLLGNYNGTPSRYTTLLNGIRKQFPNSKVLGAIGSPLTDPFQRSDFTDPPWFLPGTLEQYRDEAVKLAAHADVVIAMVGITPELEGEEMQVYAPGFSGGDRTSLDLPRPQQQLLEALAATGKPLIVVLTSGSALSVNWAQEHAAAVVEAWYPGEEGGTALAEVLAGDYNPAGRLPVTFYTGVDQLPPFDDYSMANRTYRYSKSTPLYPFGFGLSYTSFSYTNARADHDEIAATDAVTVSVDVKNTGEMAGDEVVELYLTHPGMEGAPIRALQGFTRIHLNSGEQKTVTFKLSERQLSVVDETGQRRIMKGPVEVWMGGGQPVGGRDQSPLPGVITQFRITTDSSLPD
jgi:beta-glucosidase